jgi:hypothetical protein
MTNQAFSLAESELPAAQSRAMRPRSEYLVPILLSLAIVCAPLYYYRFAGGAFNVTLFRLFLIAAFLAVLLRRLLINRRVKGWSTGAYLPLALSTGIAFLLFSLVQVFRSQYSEAPATFLIQCEGYLLVATVLLWLDSWPQFGRLVSSFVASVLIPGAIAIYQQAGYWSLGVVLPLPLTEPLNAYLVSYDDTLFGGIHLQKIGDSVFSRSASTMVDANFFGSFLGCIALVCMGIAGSRNKSRRNCTARAAPYVCALSVTLLFMTMSRTAWVGFLVGVGYLLFRTVRFRSRWLIWVIAFGILAALGLALAAYVWDLDILQLVQARIFDYERGIEARVDLIQQGFDAFEESPFFGVGRCNLIAFTGYATTHVFFLTRLFEDGLVGITMVMICLAALWWATRPGKYQHHSDDVVGMINGVRSAFLCLLVANLGYDHLMSLEVNWVVIALIFGLAKLMRRNEDAAVLLR